MKGLKCVKQLLVQLKFCCKTRTMSSMAGQGTGCRRGSAQSSRSTSTYGIRDICAQTAGRLLRHEGAQVLGRMKQLMVDNNTAASHSFLLDDDSSIPFSLDDIAALMEDKARGAPPR